MPRATPAETVHSDAPRVTGGDASGDCAVAGTAEPARARRTTPRRAAYNVTVSDAFQPLTSDLDLDRALAASHAAPVIVFKHSESCGASWRAEASLGDGALPAPVLRLVVQRSRAVSERLARLVGIRHESPQVLILVDGKVAWHTSHSGVTRERVADAWARLSAAARQPITA
jgi:bacillithiol system protein YtxJ